MEEEEEVIDLTREDKPDPSPPPPPPRRRIVADDDGHGESIDFEADPTLPTTPSRFKQRKKRATTSIVDSLLLEAGRWSEPTQHEINGDTVLQFLVAEWRRVNAEKPKKGNINQRKFALQAIRQMIDRRQQELEMPTTQELELSD